MTDALEINNAPTIPGLRFRHFEGESDFPKIANAIAASANGDRIENAITAKDVAVSYDHLVNSNPERDTILAEISGEVIGYSRACWYYLVNKNPYLYQFMNYLVPQWRDKGIRRAMLYWIEARLREIARSHPSNKTKYLETYATEYEVNWSKMLESEGYNAVRYEWEMICSTLDNIPEFPLPKGVEIRPVLPEHYRIVWEASNEHFQDNWGFAPQEEEYYQAWLNNKDLFQPDLWQIAWDVKTNKVVGQVQAYIEHQKNQKYGRQRAFIESVSVDKAWRRRGLARSLIVGNLCSQRERGVTESALSADSENLSGATRVYEDCGFRVEKQNTLYRKLL